jgi:hypothetical protein
MDLCSWSSLVHSACGVMIWRGLLSLVTNDSETYLTTFVDSKLVLRPHIR